MPAILLTNLRSINNKYDELRCHVSSQTPDVVVCTETWLNSNSPISAFSMGGYDCHRTDRLNGSCRGGVALWTKSHFRARKVPFLLFEQAEVCLVQLPYTRLLVIGVYLPPGISSPMFKNFCDCFTSTLDDILLKFPSHRLIVAGDFNQYDRSFLSSTFSLINIVNEATRSNSSLDQIFIDKEIVKKFSDPHVEIGPPIGGSDHCTVYARFRNSADSNQSRKCTFYDMRETYVMDFERCFISNDFHRFYSEEDINKKSELFYEFMHDALQAIPSRTIYFSDSDAPWITPLVKHLINLRWDAFRSRNWTVFNYLKVKVKSEVFKAKRSYFERQSRSVKGMWSYVRMEKGSGLSRTHFLDGISSIKDGLDGFNDHYCSVMNAPRDPNESLRILDDLWMPSFGVHDIWYRLSHLQSRSTGSDGIPTILYKKSALILAQPIYHLIEVCLRIRKFPTVWKIADVIPIPKTKASSFRDSRPISLLPVPAKIAENVILMGVKPFFNKCLGDNQFGIRKKSSTTHAIIAVHEALSRIADDPSFGAAVFIGFDFSKAFDKCYHSDLICKALELNFPGGFVAILKSYLENRQQRVRYNGFKSNIKSITSGVPQGSLLGPYLFGLYIASLQSRFKSTTMVKYVDDLSLVLGIRKSHILDDVQRIKSEILEIQTWSSSNGMVLNVEKTNGFIRYRGSFRDICNIESLIPDVRFTDSVRFLGVFLDSDLAWKSHIRYVERKCAQRLFVLRRMCSVSNDEQFVTIYSALIRTLLEYAAPSFVGLSTEDARRLQRIQNRCMRIKGINLVDLSTRRLLAAKRLFRDIQTSDTFLRNFYPQSLPSGRLSVPFCRTSMRRNSFFPKMCIHANAVHCD